MLSSNQAFLVYETAAFEMHRIFSAELEEYARQTMKGLLPHISARIPARIRKTVRRSPNAVAAVEQCLADFVQRSKSGGWNLLSATIGFHQALVTADAVAVSRFGDSEALRECVATLRRTAPELVGSRIPYPGLER